MNDEDVRKMREGYRRVAKRLYLGRIEIMQTKKSLLLM